MSSLSAMKFASAYCSLSAMKTITAGQPSYRGLQYSHGSLNISNLSLDNVDRVISGTQLCFHYINISIKFVS
jgi:hypothetical protein